ncbi:MAG: DNA polymerase I [Candidatus Sericytochromatia bacterium]|nr:DNA polymerase I [Candidatus Sericytochromatia bacterium]
MPTPPRLLLIDGHALAYRAYFALMRRGFATRDGRPTGAIFGFVKMMLEAVGNLRPTCLAVAFDRAAPTFRHEAYDRYKAHRARMDDDMIAQMAPLREVVAAFDVPMYELDGFEADDLIGTLSRQAEAEGFDVEILTGDRDAFQLVSERTSVLLPRSGVGDLEVFGPDAVLAKMGVTPAQIPDLKGLMGDASDNIPGVPGVGEKSAVKLLQAYGTIANLYEHLGEVPGKLGEKLRDHTELAQLSLRLATIDRDAPIRFDAARCHLTMPDLGRLTQTLEALEFTSIIRQLPQSLAAFAPAGATVPSVVSAGVGAAPLNQAGQAGLFDALPMTPEPVVQVARPLALNLTLVDTPTALAQLVDTLTQSETFVYDVETTGLQALRCDLVGLAIAVGGPDVAACRTFYIPLGHAGATNLEWEAVRTALAPAFADPHKLKVAHNEKFDLQVLTRHGLVIAPPTYDTMIADYLVESGRQSHALKELAWEHLRYEMTEIKALIGTGQKAITMAEVPLDKAAPYAAADVAVTAELRHFLDPLLDARGQRALFDQVELPLVPVLAAMERHGVKLDLAWLASLSETLGSRIAAAESEIHTLAGGGFNINSPKQLAVVLFEKLQLPVIKRTKTGPSTDAEVLEELSDSHEVVRRILEYRQLVKLKNTYVDALPTMVNPATGRVHTSFNQTIAATGRLSSQEPNLQNIPIRTELGREIRRAFIPSEPNRVIVSADYSQIELRILAHVTADPTFIQAFREDRDIHAVTASEIFNVPLAEVTSEMRRRAKTTNFGIVYGQSDFGLSKALGIPRKEAREFIERFNARYPGIQHYMIRTIAQAKRDGFVETLSGRRRYIPEIHASNRQVRDFGERMAINAPIQGTAADIIKLAMVRLAPRLTGLPAVMLLQVHDELVFEVAPQVLPEVTALIRQEMEGAFALDVPLRVDIHSGATWMDAK